MAIWDAPISPTGTPDPAAPVVAMRASDSDRMATVLVIQDGIARGLLTTAEGEERIVAAFGTVHRSGLAPLTADLPPADRPRRLGSWSDLSALALGWVLFALNAIARLPRRIRIIGAVLIGLVFFLLLLADLGFDHSDDERGPAGFHGLPD